MNASIATCQQQQRTWQQQHVGGLDALPWRVKVDFPKACLP
jgi:hypothetical protein